MLYCRGGLQRECRVMRCELIQTGERRDGMVQLACAHGCKKANGDVRTYWVKNGQTITAGHCKSQAGPDERPTVSVPDGPGTELAKLFAAAGASSDQCGGICRQWRDQMNLWGVEGCRQHRQEIIDRIETAAYKT